MNRIVNRRVLLNSSGSHYCRDGMLENQLFLIVRLEHKRIFIEALDTPGELYAAQQINRDQTFFLARIIEKTILDVLRWFVHLWFQLRP